MTDARARPGGEGLVLRLFSVSGVIGLVIALWLVLAPWGGDPGTGPEMGPVAARVNGVPITMAEFEQAAQAAQNDSRNALGSGEARQILETLVSEELLVQEAVRLDLVSTDNDVRAAAVRAIMRLILSDVASRNPSRDELRTFYNDNPDLFAQAARLWVRHMAVDIRRTEDIAQIASELREGASFSQILERHEGVVSRPVPDRVIRAEDLSQYLGGGLAEVARAAPEGTVLGPIPREDDAHFLWIVEREEGARRSFDEVERQLSDEWRRRAEDAAVERYLERLRARAAVEIEALTE